MRCRCIVVNSHDTRLQPAGNRTLTHLTHTDAGRFTYLYDDAGHIRGVVNPQAKRTTYTYDAADRLTRRDLAISFPTTYAYDNANRVSLIVYGGGLQNSYSRDRAK